MSDILMSGIRHPFCKSVGCRELVYQKTVFGGKGKGGSDFGLGSGGLCGLLVSAGGLAGLVPIIGSDRSYGALGASGSRLAGGLT